MEKEIINFSVPSLAFNIKSLDTKNSTPWRGNHSHSAIELIFVKSGAISCHIEDECIKAYAGDIILINSEVIHFLESKSTGDILYIQIDINEYNAYYSCEETGYINEFLTKTNAVRYLLEKEDGELHGILKNILNELSKKEKHYEEYVKAYIFMLSAFMYRNAMLSEAHCGAEKIRAVTEYIEKSYMYPISLELLAENTAFGKFELCRIFKKITGGTVVEYINYVRLKKAELMLKNSEKTISEIAFECGFSSIQYFNKVFKKQKGCSPKTYRKQRFSN